MRVTLKSIFIILLITSACSCFGASRTWTVQQIPSFNCGIQPTMALLNGVQPVISNYNISSGLNQRIIRETAFGWFDYSVTKGYIAGDGKGNIRSSKKPLTYGQDGQFYSYSNPTYNTIYPITLSGYKGTSWSLPSSQMAFVDADPYGTIYIAGGSNIAMCLGSTWSASMSLNGSAIVQDMDISSYGDVAVSSSSPLGNSVTYYDYKSGFWNSRIVCKFYSGLYKVNVEWDKKGNLGVAYYDSEIESVKFDYLDMQTSNWTSEIVYTSSYNSFGGAALAYDRFDDPVIACGSYLFYDGNPSSVPEPSSFAALAMGGIALLGFLKKKE